MPRETHKKITQYAVSRMQASILILIGTQFQRDVLQEVHKIPYGETRSYKDIACLIGKPRAYRAVALASSANLLCLIVPCHRVITASGVAGGYAGDANAKRWLINHEVRIVDVMNSVG
jgi:AraC family transcriptional regulator of adaptative response/methylated-DNA-[protein]-cysteine methyltransferase